MNCINKNQRKIDLSGIQHFLYDCAQRRLTWAYAFVQSYQRFRRALCCWPMSQSVLRRAAKTDQTARMRRLIWVFAGRTSNLVENAMPGSFYLTNPITAATNWQSSWKRNIDFLVVLQEAIIHWHKGRECHNRYVHTMLSAKCSPTPPRPF